MHWVTWDYLIADCTNFERLDSDPDCARSDPVKFCSHIPGHIKQTKHRIAQQKIEATMTQEERNQEREIQHRQMEEIFRVMEDQKDKFGVNDMADIQDQMKMYIQWICCQHSLQIYFFVVFLSGA